MSQINLYFENQFTNFESLFLEIGEEVIIEKGTVISALDNQIYLYYVQEGIFILALDHEEGERKAFCYHADGSINPYSPARPDRNGEFKVDLDFFNIIAITDVKTIRIKPNVFYETMLEYPKLAIAMLDYVIDHSNLYLNESLHLSYNTAYTKTCYFVFIYTQYLMQYGIRLTQSEIGEFIGESRLEVARALKKLREMAIVETSRTNIKVLDLDALKIEAGIDY